MMVEMSTRVLVVDDEPKIVEMVRLYLERDGHEVSVARDGEAALEKFHRDRPDLVVLDLMLPGMNGVEVCTRIRRDSSVPIIMLTARAEEVDKLLGLAVGADDYVTKPFSPRELAARVQAVLRRSRGGSGDRSDRIEAGGLVIDEERHEVACDGRGLSLTPTEFRLLAAMARHPGRVYSRGQLVEEAMGEQFEGYDRSIDAHVKNLRRKLSDTGAAATIETVYGVGYRFAEAARA